MEQKIIINFTPTGMIPTKAMTPHVPISVDEIIEDVRKACEIGITMVHLHARDPISGEPTYKKELYANIIEGIREFDKQLIVCVSLSGRNFKELEQRADPLYLENDLKPDMGSLTLSSLNFNKTASLNAPSMVQDLARIMKENGIVPELEAFDSGMINYARYLENKGLIEPPFYFNLLLGNIACAQANLLHAGMMVNDLPDNSIWSFAGIGNAQLKMNTLAIAMGGGVRVGIEDNIWYDQKRSKLSSNTDFLERIHRLAKVHDREIMPSSELRSLLNLKSGNGEYGR
jgi:uncharacterized protein (DUF849 family)